MITRRGFLKILGAATATAAMAPHVLSDAVAATSAPKIYTPAAPAIIPPARLEATPTRSLLPSSVRYDEAALRDMVPMIMLKPTYYYPYGKLEANSTPMIHRRDAGRWLDWGIAVPQPGFAVERDTARRALEAQYSTQPIPDLPYFPRRAEVPGAQRHDPPHGPSQIFYDDIVGVPWARLDEDAIVTSAEVKQQGSTAFRDLVRELKRNRKPIRPDATHIDIEWE